MGEKKGKEKVGEKRGGSKRSRASLVPSQSLFDPPRLRVIMAITDRRLMEQAAVPRSVSSVFAVFVLTVYICVRNTIAARRFRRPLCFSPITITINHLESYSYSSSSSSSSSHLLRLA